MGIQILERESGGHTRGNTPDTHLLPTFLLTGLIVSFHWIILSLRFALLCVRMSKKPRPWGTGAQVETSWCWSPSEGIVKWKALNPIEEKGGRKVGARWLPSVPPSTSLQCLGPSVWFGWLDCRGACGRPRVGYGEEGEREKELTPIAGSKLLSWLRGKQPSESLQLSCALLPRKAFQIAFSTASPPYDQAVWSQEGTGGGILSLPLQDSD